MDRQRCGQRDGDRGRVRDRAARLVPLLAAVLIGCAGEPRTPFGLVDDDDDGSGGTRGTSSQPSALIGTWEAVILIQAGDDVQEWRTRWSFNSNRTCHFTRTTLSLAEGIPRTVDRACTFRDQNATAEVTFTETGATQSLPYSAPDNSRERLLLEGIEYERVS